jgi:DNA-binding transcriptional MerR regulator
MARSHHNTTRTFSHLTVFDRGQIQALRNQGKSLQEIADIIGCHKSTISRELKRGTVTQRRSDLTEYQAYFADVGQRVYESNRSRCGAKDKLIQTTDFIPFAVQKIRDDTFLLTPFAAMPRPGTCSMGNGFAPRPCTAISTLVCFRSRTLICL